MPMLQGKRAVELDAASLESYSEQKQRRRMLAALALLLVALIVVLIKDWQFWFPPQSAESETVAPSASVPATVAARSIPEKGAKPAAVSVRSSKRPSHAAPAIEASPAAASPTITANRAVLPPLEIEVVAGGKHRAVQAGNNSVKVDMQEDSLPSDRGSAGSGVKNSAERVTLSPGTADVVSSPVEPSYPLLAKQMKVQGAVVLQALIGKTGNIQDLRVVSGPDILSAAARQAVKQWRFKPYLQNGQPVETEARITVNFTISTY
jgi:TonB family protein